MWRAEKFSSKHAWKKIESLKTNLGFKKLGIQKPFWSKKKFVQKEFWSKKSLVSRNFWSKKKVWSKCSLVQKLEPKRFWIQKNFSWKINFVQRKSYQMNDRRKKMESTEIWGKSILGLRKFDKKFGWKKLRPKMFEVKENFEFKRFLIPNEFWVKKMSQIFYCQKRI